MDSKKIEKALYIIKKHNNPSLSLIMVEMKLSLEEAQEIFKHLEANGLLSDSSIPPTQKSAHKIESNNNESLSSPFNIDELEGHAFEYYCADLLRYNQFTRVQVTSGSGDYGVDILCQKDSKTYAIQCKCYSKNVGNKAVQEVVSGKIFYKCDYAIVMTNSYFTPAAHETARLTDVELWDRGRIRELHRIAITNGFKPQKY